jgi:hypothetical protein
LGNNRAITPMSRSRHALALLAACVLAGCSTRAVDVRPTPADPADFAAWSCDRIHDEQDLVQQKAADVAYAVDERAGTNILALGVGVTVFWPALFALRPDGIEAADLARLKGRFEALQIAATLKRCPAPGAELSAARAAQLPVAVGERLVYEDRRDPRRAASEWVLRVAALKRGEFDFDLESATASGPWRQDRAGNVLSAPTGSLQWPRLLRVELNPGTVMAGEMLIVGDAPARARLRGQVVAVGVQMVAGRRFDAAVVELFGDAQRGESSTRVEGAMVVDRDSGVLLRLDLKTADTGFALQRRLVRIEPGR